MITCHFHNADLIVINHPVVHFAPLERPRNGFAVTKLHERFRKLRRLGRLEKFSLGILTLLNIPNLLNLLNMLNPKPFPIPQNFLCFFRGRASGAMTI